MTLRTTILLLSLFTFLFSTASAGKPKEILTLADDFDIQVIYKADKKKNGSWVSMTQDDKGRLYCSDQLKAGIFRLTLQNNKVKVEKIKNNISGAMGMSWVRGKLYVHNNKGLYRLSDSNNDGHLDKAEHLNKYNGRGEHAQHGLVLNESEKSLFMVAGNMTRLPKSDQRRFPSKWGEDLLLPREHDSKGHAKGIRAPGGWIAKVDLKNHRYEVYSMGFRNAYDIAFNHDGELFGYDSDMEWDMGMPWYRPTRVSHITSGSDFGWRTGSGKWPTYYEDSLPPLIEIGPGSPTGVVFGYGAKFPPKYQKAMFIYDWTYATIYALHLKEKGSSYTAEKEVFLTGLPLPLTDGLIGKDGNMYFLTGGRRTQTTLYRIKYKGSEDTSKAVIQGSEQAAAARATRRQLEAFHGKEDEKCIELAWPHLSSQDRFIRFAARVAIESQPLSQWKNKAMEAKDAQTIVTSAVALARAGKSEDQKELLNKLTNTNAKKMTETQQLAMLRAYALSFIRMGAPDDQQKKKIIEKLNALLPSKNDDVNTELIRVLVYLDSPDIIEKTLSLIEKSSSSLPPDWSDLIQRNDRYGSSIKNMLKSYPPVQKISWAFMLRNLRFGWTLDQRKKYHQFINDVSKYSGGASFRGNLKNIRKTSLKNCSEAERRALAKITGEKLEKPKKFKVSPPKGPGKLWDLAMASATIKEGLHNRNFESGRNLYHATLCATCHRFDGEGGDIGPDLTSAGTKFSLEELLESIIEPSRVISDQYGSYIVTLKDGKQHEGVISEFKENNKEMVEIHGRDPEAKSHKVERELVQSIEQSKVSSMPPGLINSLNENELKDLLAYIISRGSKNHSVYKKVEISKQSSN